MSKHCIIYSEIMSSFFKVTNNRGQNLLRKFTDIFKFEKIYRHFEASFSPSVWKAQFYNILRKVHENFENFTRRKIERFLQLCLKSCLFTKKYSKHVDSSVINLQTELSSTSCREPYEHLLSSAC